MNNNVFLDYTLRSNYAMTSRGVDSISVSDSSSVEGTVCINCLNLEAEFVVVYCTLCLDISRYTCMISSRIPSALRLEPSAAIIVETFRGGYSECILSRMNMAWPYILYR